MQVDVHNVNQDIINHKFQRQVPPPHHHLVVPHHQVVHHLVQLQHQMQLHVLNVLIIAHHVHKQM